MSSVFVDLAAALQALLEDPLIDGARVSRDRLSPVIKENTRAINVKLDKASMQRGGIAGSPDDWVTDFDVELYGRAPADQLPTEFVDDLLIGVFGRLNGASALDELLALDVQDVLPDPQITWDPTEAGGPQICATVNVRFVHRTKPGQLVPWSRP